MSGYVLKAAEAVTDATVNWREGYLEPGEYIDGDLGWSVEPSGAEIIAQDFDDSSSRARIARGLPGQVYMLCARAMTNTGRRIERALVLRIAA